MGKLLSALCFRGREPSHPQARLRCGTVAGIIGIGINLLLCLGKLGAGFFTHSVAMVADGVNNLSDAASSIVTLAGFRIAGQEADAHHPFGHGRMEYISGFIVAIAILLMGAELVRSSFHALAHPSASSFSPLATIILILAIGLKLWLFWFNRTFGRKIASAAMEATAMDSLSDSAATGVVLLSALLQPITTLPVDGLAGLLVAGFILKAGWDAARSTLDPLLGRPMNPALASDIEQLVRSHTHILGIHDVIYHDYGPGRAMMSFHAEVPADQDLISLHDLIDHIERELKAKHHIETVIHMDPVVTDIQTTQLRDQVTALTKQLDPLLTIHDFRITLGPMHTNLIFDVLVPYHFRLNDQQVRAELTSEIKKLSPRYCPVIQVDHSFVELPPEC